MKISKVLLAAFGAFLLVSAICSAQDPYEGFRQKWLQTAQQSTPAFVYRTVEPQSVVRAVKDEKAFQCWRYENEGKVCELYSKNFKEVEQITLDFGEHLVGYFQFHTKTLTRCMDAPVRLKLTFAELPAELNTPLDPWSKTRLGRAWMQDETITLTRLDEWVKIPRRIAFRYVKIEMMGWPGGGYDFAIDNIKFEAQTTAGDISEDLALRDSCPEIFQKINNVGLNTLRNCMQTVYEDGPKRDQRLWIGDLYLQALANRYSFRNNALTKRCLYLFAGLAREDGVLFADIIEDPVPHPQYGSYIPSYALLWAVTLADYYYDTEDLETVNELFPVAKVQIQEGLSFLDDNKIFDVQRKTAWMFIDHRPGLEVTASMQGCLIFALKRTYELACSIGRQNEVSEYPALIKSLTKAARNALLDKKTGMIVSGPEHQVSIMSQSWAVIGGILSPKEGQKAISSALKDSKCVMPGTPYGTHYLIEAMLLSGMNKEARDYMEGYWGEMVRKGADTFWEAYDPTDDLYSPYGFHPLNSACHAWSCTPVYFIHKYPEVFQQ